MNVNCKIHQNYFPWANQGISIRMSCAIEKGRVYDDKPKISLSIIGFYPAFEWPGSVDNYYGEYYILTRGEWPEIELDYNVIISRN